MMMRGKRTQTNLRKRQEERQGLNQQRNSLDRCRRADLSERGCIIESVRVCCYQKQLHNQFKLKLNKEIVAVMASIAKSFLQSYMMKIFKVIISILISSLFERWILCFFWIIGITFVKIVKRYSNNTFTNLYSQTSTKQIIFVVIYFINLVFIKHGVEHSK